MVELRAAAVVSRLLTGRIALETLQISTQTKDLSDALFDVCADAVRLTCRITSRCADLGAICGQACPLASHDALKVTQLLDMVDCAVLEAQHHADTHPASTEHSAPSFVQLGDTAAVGATGSASFNNLVSQAIRMLSSSLTPSTFPNPVAGVGLNPNQQTLPAQMAKSSVGGMQSGAAAVTSLFPKMIGPQTLVPYQVDNLLINVLTGSGRPSSTDGEYQRLTQPPLIKFEFEKVVTKESMVSGDVEELRKESKRLDEAIASAQANVKRLKQMQSDLIRKRTELVGGDTGIVAQLVEKAYDKLGAPLSMILPERAPVDEGYARLVQDAKPEVKHPALESYNSGDPLDTWKHALANMLNPDS